MQNNPLNTPSVKALAKSVVNAIDFPDSFITNVGEYTYKLGGKSIFDPFEKLLTLICPDLVASARQYYKQHMNPINQGFVMTDPMTLIFWLVFYLAMIVILYFVGKFVAYPGKPLELKSFSLVHNIILCAFSLYMGILFIANALAEPDFTIVDMPQTKSLSFAKIVWLFGTVSKIQEFIDTFIMVLKQNYHQLSFLHVYHHLSILVFTWHFALMYTGGDGWVSGFLNCMVHTVMYFYYAATTFAGKTGPLRSFLNSIKFIITKGQLTQFAINFCHGLYVVFVVGEKSAFFIPMRWMIIYMMTMLALFGHFFDSRTTRSCKSKKIGGATRTRF